MADIFIEGFAKYGPANSVSDTVEGLLTQGEWTSVTKNRTASLGTDNTVFWSLIDGVFNNSFGLHVEMLVNNSSIAYGFLNKSLPGNYSRLIGGFKFSGTLYNDVGTFTELGILLCDGIGTPQIGLFLNTDGKIDVRVGGNTVSAPTIVIDASTASISANSEHQLEFDITIHDSAGAYEVWLDGVSIIGPVSSTNTRGGTSNNYANTLTLFGEYHHQISGIITASIGTFGHLYLFDSTGGVNDSVLLTNPIVDTYFPIADDSVDFNFGAAILGEGYSSISATNAPGANELFLRKFTPGENCTIDSVSIMPQATSATAKFKAAIYPDSGGSPNGQSLMSGGTEVVGCTLGTALVGPLTSPQSLTSGTPYWIGFLTDTNVILAEVDATVTGVKASSSYGSGVPGTCPSVTISQPSWEIYGNLSGVGVNYFEVDGPYPLGDISYVESNLVNDEDLFNFPSLTTTPTNIYTVCVKGFAKKSSSGARTIDLRTKSGATDDGGDNPGQSLGSSYEWLESFFDVDPDTSSAWTEAGLNAATSGYKIVS